MSKNAANQALEAMAILSRKYPELFLGDTEIDCADVIMELCWLVRDSKALLAYLKDNSK